jgi:hypothetical protein
MQGSEHGEALLPPQQQQQQPPGGPNFLLIAPRGGADNQHSDQTCFTKALACVASALLLLGVVGAWFTLQQHCTGELPHDLTECGPMLRGSGGNRFGF